MELMTNILSHFIVDTVTDLFVIIQYEIGD